MDKGSFVVYKVCENPQPIQLYDVTSNVEPTYPSAYFKKGHKPMIDHFKLKKPDDLNKLACNIAVKGEGDVDIAIAFLCEFAKELNTQLEDDWISFGMKIGGKGDYVNPLSVFECRDKEIDKTGDTKDIKKADGPGLATILLSVIRLSPFTGTAEFDIYRQQIANKILAQAISMGLDKNSKFKMEIMAANCLSWVNNATYRKICAGYDMFFAKFPNHKYAQMRISTLTCRFRECSAILSYGYIAKALGLSINELMQWIFVKDVSADVERMFRSGEELDKEDSYTPYIMDMGISLKSPYSAASNQSIHMFLHVVGATMSVARSCNAKLLSGGSVTGPVMNGMLMAYAFSKVAIMNRIYTGTAAESSQLFKFAGQLTESVDTDGDDQGGIPKDLFPSSWIAWFQDSGCRFPDHVMDDINAKWSRIQSPRPNSIGLYLKQRSGAAVNE